jgi:hypothetical protein
LQPQPTKETVCDYVGVGGHSKWNTERVMSVSQENVFDPGSDTSITGGSQIVRCLLPTTELFKFYYS